MTRIAFELDLREPARRRVLARAEIWPEPGARALELAMAVWTPGSYLVREYAKQLGNFAATNAGRPLAWSKPSKNRYRVQLAGGDDPVHVEYTIHAHELSVRTSDLTDQHALLQGAATFLWPYDADGPIQPNGSVEIRLLLQNGWQVATTLKQADDCFLAAGLDELVDSPILAGSQLHRLSFEVLGKRHSYVMDGLGPIEPPTQLVSDTTKIIEAAAALFDGELPYEDYQFLSLFSDGGRGGLEHLDSSVLLAPRTTFDEGEEYRDFMGLVAHEHFHVWNVKRMRPKEQWLFDYENENYTALLWVAEGFTAYYDDLLCLRAGVLDRRQYLDLLAKTIAEMRRTPGRLHHSLSGSSFDAWIRLYRPDEDTRNSTLSYYGNGSLAALLIDMEVRVASGGQQSLDDVMRSLWNSTYCKGRGYDREDVQRCIDEAAGKDLSGFVTGLVDGPFDPDLQSALSAFGLVLEDVHRKGAYLGVVFKSGSTRLGAVRRGSAAEQAGLAPGDELLGVQGLRVSASNWSSVFGAVAQPDEDVEVLLARRGVLQTLTLRPSAAPPEKVRIKIDEDADAAAIALRDGWLGA